jgi:hypothetical protein
MVLKSEKLICYGLKNVEMLTSLFLFLLILIYLLTAIGLSPGGGTHFHMNTT